MHESYIEQYAQDIDFKDVYATSSQGKNVEELDYHVKDDSYIIVGSSAFHKQRE